MEEADENGIVKNYKSCYEHCPYHATQLKYLDDKECVSYCPRFKTSEGNCLDYCDYKSCKYLLKNESICYNYIPSNYYIYIDDYNDTYQDNDKPKIKIKEECPDSSYDSSFKYFCIKLEEDIFHLIENPNDLIRYSDPMIKYLKTKQMIIRAYSSDKKIDDIDNNKNKKIRIDISLCEQKIKKYHNLSNAEILIIQDVFNTETQKYLYKIFTKEGEELNINVCESDDISIKEIYYNIEKEQNTTKCPSGYPYLDLNKGICLKSCDIMSFLDKSCTTDVTIEENQINNINNIKKTIESHSIDYLLDNITNGGEDIIIEEKNIKYQLSSTSNQNNNKHSNISNILLGKCETNLKEKYNISLNTSLLIFKVDAYVDGFSSPIVEYEVYNPITKEKLDLKCCENEQINVAVPVSINESELYKYDPNNEFYNDICSTFTTNSKTDITLSDRQNEFLENNMSLCENDCNYVSYDSTLKKAECECNVKFKIKDLYEVKIDKEKLKMKFNIKNLVNIKVMKCFKKLFNKNGLLYNIGSYIILAIIFIYLICLIYLRLKDFYSLKIEIISYFNFLKCENDFIEDKKIIIKENIPISKDYESKNKRNQKKSKTELIISNEKMISKDKTIVKPFIEPIGDNIKKKNNSHKREIKKIQTNKSSKKQLYNNNNTNKNNKKSFFNDYELNNYKYKNALLCDKRTFCQYYSSLVKYEHLLFFAIIQTKDFNSKAIKICILLFSFALYLSNKALFMNEETMHNIYIKNGDYDIVYQLPQILYSCIISSIINNIIRYFSLSGKDVIKIQRNKSDENLGRIYQKLINTFVIKFTIFFIISFIFLFIFWVYISCFCFVYRNTQIYLIKDTLISFGLSLAYPFIFYLFSATFRIFSLRDKAKTRNYVYKMGNLLII